MSIDASARRARGAGRGWALRAALLATASLVVACQPQGGSGGETGARAQAQAAQPEAPPGDWRTINGNLAATRYSPLKDIDKTNVANLAVSWTYAIRGISEAVPLVVDGVMYVPSGGKIVALDADAGTELWTYTVGAGP